MAIETYLHTVVSHYNLSLLAVFLLYDLGISQKKIAGYLLITSGLLLLHSRIHIASLEMFGFTAGLKPLRRPIHNCFL